MNIQVIQFFPRPLRTVGLVIIGILDICLIQTTSCFMPAYWIARAKIIHLDSYRKYAEAVPDIIKRFGGRVLAKGGDSVVLEGTEHFTRFVVIEFDSLAQGKACFDSDEYQKAAESRRHGAGDVDLVLVSGVS